MANGNNPEAAPNPEKGNDELWKSNAIYANYQNGFKNAVTHAFFKDPNGEINPEAESFKNFLKQKYGEKKSPEEYISAFENKEKAGNEKMEKAASVSQKAREKGNKEQDQSRKEAEIFLQSAEKTAWQNPTASLPRMMNPNILPGSEKYELPALDKTNLLSFFEKAPLEQQRKNFLKSLVSDMGKQGMSEKYWNSCHAPGSFQDLSATPTCATAVNYHLQKIGRSGKIQNPAWAENYEIGSPKEKSMWQPGDLVVYNKRMVEGKDAGGHIGIFMGFFHGEPMVWSENVAANKDGDYYGPLVHAINYPANAGIMNPRVYSFDAI